MIDTKLTQKARDWTPEKKRNTGAKSAQVYGVPDEENPEWTTEEIRTAKPFAEAFPDLAAQEIARRRRPQKPTPTALLDLFPAEDWVPALRSTDAPDSSDPERAAFAAHRRRLSRATYHQMLDELEGLTRSRKQKTRLDDAALYLMAFEPRAAYARAFLMLSLEVAIGNDSAGHNARSRSPITRADARRGLTAIKRLLTHADVWRSRGAKPKRRPIDRAAVRRDYAIIWKATRDGFHRANGDQNELRAELVAIVHAHRPELGAADVAKEAQTVAIYHRRRPAQAASYIVRSIHPGLTAAQLRVIRNSAR